MGHCGAAWWLWAGLVAAGRLGCCGAAWWQRGSLVALWGGLVAAGRLGGCVAAWWLCGSAWCLHGMRDGLVVAGGLAAAGRLGVAVRHAGRPCGCGAALVKVWFGCWGSHVRAGLACRSSYIAF